MNRDDGLLNSVLDFQVNEIIKEIKEQSDCEKANTKRSGSFMKMIDISELWTRKLQQGSGQLREFDDHYEYCFIKDYEMKYDDFNSQAVQIGDIFVNLLELKTKTIMVSLFFPKTYDVHEIAEWLNGNQVSFNEKDKVGYYIPHASKILESLNFKGLPIVVATKGNEKIYYKTTVLTEVTKKYKYFSEIVNPAFAKEIDTSDKDTIYLNGKNITEIPHIEFDLGKDEIYVNGAFVAADYLDETGRIKGIYNNSNAESCTYE
ncbi:hypothetical protein J9303_20955 [Bacillaceae bacterium Marseille-Q3522]|nr:hypothetical protein [Bacillaceae bacterium Marseille-Q3522]